MKSEQVMKYGAVMTPSHVVEAMLDMLDPEKWSDPYQKVCEPSVGDGAFVEGALKRFMIGLEGFEPDPTKRRRWIFERIIYAVDIQPQMIEKCIVRFDLAELDHNFVVGDFLTMDVRSWLNRKD